MDLRVELDLWTSNVLKIYVALLRGTSSITRKHDRIEFIAKQLLQPKALKKVWQSLDPISQRAVSVAYHNDGEFDADAFVAQYEALPPRPGKTSSYWYYDQEPILFDLFVIDEERIPSDLMPLLADLVLPLERFQITPLPTLPERIEYHQRMYPIEQVDTELIGPLDLLTYLKMVEQDEMRFSIGAYLLGQVDVYTPPQPAKKSLFTIDEQRQLQLLDEPLPHERLQLDSIAEKITSQTYQLDKKLLLTAVESGQSMTYITEFLQANHQGDLPEPVAAWLTQLNTNLGAFKEVDEAVIIKLRDSGL